MFFDNNHLKNAVRQASDMVLDPTTWFDNPSDNIKRFTETPEHKIRQALTNIEHLVFDLPTPMQFKNIIVNDTDGYTIVSADCVVRHIDAGGIIERMSFSYSISHNIIDQGVNAIETELKREILKILQG